MSLRKYTATYLACAKLPSIHPDEYGDMGVTNWCSERICSMCFHTKNLKVKENQAVIVRFMEIEP